MLTETHPIPCGLNADWNCQAWHFGPGATPNATSGDVYVLEDEESEGIFDVVRRTYGDEDEVVVLASGLSWDAAVEMARAAAQS